jgi:hypothetical protein
MYALASTTLTANANNIVFSSIPQNFTHLQLRLYGRGTGTSGPNINMQYNGDAAGNYRVHYLGGNTTSAFAGDFGASYTASNMGWLCGSDTAANYFSSVITDILDYSNTSKNKTSKSLTGAEANTNSLLGFFSAGWFSTAAINSITLTPSAGQFAVGTRLDLYGVLKSNTTGA